MFISFHARGSQTCWLIQTQHCECEQLLWESQVTFIFGSRTYWCRLWCSHKIFSWPHLPHATEKLDRCIDVCCFRNGIDTGRLTPSLPQPVIFPGWKMHGRASKQYIFQSYNSSTFNVMRFSANPFSCSCEKEDRRLKGFVSHFYWSFSSDFTAVKGLSI